MIHRTRHTLITAEILGFFMIMVGLLAILTNRQVFIIAASVLFGIIVLVAAMFAVFATLAVRQGNSAANTRKKK
jgi:hypothetical protein